MIITTGIFMSANRKAKNKKDKKIEEMETVINNNSVAILNGRRKKTFTTKDMKVVKPLTQPQQQMMNSYFSNINVLGVGSAGTGKTYISMYLAFNDVLSKSQPQNKIVLVKSAVASRDIGFLPGDIEDKLEPLEQPYKDIIGDLFSAPTAYDNFKSLGTIDFMSTSYVRGLTWDNCVIVIDEAQNMNFHEINSIVTRMGVDSKLIIIGDTKQTDLYKHSYDKSGLELLCKVIHKVKNFDTINFTSRDIVRSDFTKSWIEAVEEYL